MGCTVAKNVSPTPGGAQQATTITDQAGESASALAARKTEEDEERQRLSQEAAATIEKQVATLLKIKENNQENIAAVVFDVDYFNSLDESLKLRLLKCVKSGIENPDSTVGCYACQPDDYDTFKPFFAKVLERYHNVDLSAKKHVNNWSLDSVDGLPADGKLDLTKLGLPALSIRVRTGRNLKRFPLPGSMTKQDRIDMEKAMGKVMDQLISMPQYGGRYVSITPGHPNFINEAEYQELVDAHIMFKSMAADKFLVEAGISGDWPHGRGCYISNDKGFIIWVGEEDHLRIMCMGKGTILNDVFDRLKVAIDIVEDLIEGGCAKSDEFGVVTSCPTNVGTAMRASVHIQLPKLTADGTDAKAKAICKPLGLSVRGLGGEHTAIGADGTVDISPSARFCISEAEIIAALYKGIELVKKKEDEESKQIAQEAKVAAEVVSKWQQITKTEEKLAAKAVNKWQEFSMQKQVATILKIKEANPENIAAVVFDVDYFNSLNKSQKVRLLKCVKSGIKNPDSTVGCYACQPDDYDIFKPFFAKVLERYHNVDLSAKKHVNNWSLDSVDGLPADGKLDLTKLGLPALSIRVRTGRNLKRFPLPGSMTKQDRIDMEKAMGKVMDQLISMPQYGGRYVSITPGHPNFINEAEYQELVDAHIMFKSMAADKFLVEAGISGDWPHGRGCYISNDKGFIIWVGEEDHLRIMCMGKGTILNDVFDRLKVAIDIVEDLIEGGCAKSDEFGVVTSCPTNVGTAMRASVHIQLPKLTADGTDAKAKAICKPLGLSVRGLGGEHTAIGADGTVDISPSARFCISEAEIIAALYKGIELVKKKEDEESK